MLKTVDRLIIAMVLLALALWFGLCQASPPPTTTGPASVPAGTIASPTNAIYSPDVIRVESAELQAKAYKESVGHLKWALGAVLTISLAFVAYALFKNTREYRQALAEVEKAVVQGRDAAKEARDASKEARQASDKAREYEDKARDQLRSIDTLVSQKLEEIEKRGKRAQRKVTLTSQKRLGIADLFSKGLNALQDKDFVPAANYFQQVVDIDKENFVALNNLGYVLSEQAKTKHSQEAEKLFKQACQKYEEAIAIQPDYSIAWSNWGAALSLRGETKEDDQAERLFEQACQKYKKAVAIKPDDSNTWSNWGVAFLYWARKKVDKERKALLDQAKEKLDKAESLKVGSGAYNLACLYGQLGDKEQCRKWLEVAEQADELSTRRHAMDDPDLKGVRDEQWFKDLRWRGDPGQR